MSLDDYHCPDKEKVVSLKDVANWIRITSIESTTAAGSGHPTSCCSQAELLSVLFFHTMKLNVNFPRDPASDRFILSKGHAAPALYAAWAETGLISRRDCLNLRKIDSDLEGHPTPRLSFIDVATGSLGQGLGVSCGMAYCGKYIDKSNYRVYCLMGDGESAEGSVWEAMSFASYYHLDNLVAIIDVNRLGQSQPTQLEHQMAIYKARCEAFGMNTYVVDGHDVEALCKVFHLASLVKGKPSCILAQTFKGKGIENIEDKLNWHGKPLGALSEEAVKHIKAQIHNAEHGLLTQNTSSAVPAVDIKNVKLSEPPSYGPNDKIATRQAYGTALVKIGKSNSRVIALDAEVKNSTFSITYKNSFPDRFVECFIAEQNMVGIGMGLACRDRAIVFCSTFAAFFARAADQLRMAAPSFSNINCVGSHVGVSIGEDGPSQMALEDISLFRSIEGSTVFYPSDGVSIERAVELAANTDGICYIRTSRPASCLVYGNNETFEIGKAKIVKQTVGDKAVVIAAGVTLHEAIKAYEQLSEVGVTITIIDPFTIKPIDGETILAAAQQAQGNVIVVEDHYASGGIGEAVSSQLVGHSEIKNFRHLCVRSLPRSGPPSLLLKKYGISAEDIVKAVKSFN